MVSNPPGYNPVSTAGNWKRRLLRPPAMTALTACWSILLLHLFLFGLLFFHYVLPLPVFPKKIVFFCNGVYIICTIVLTLLPPACSLLFFCAPKFRAAVGLIPFSLQNNTHQKSPAWVDASNGDNFGYCSSACASVNGATNIIGQWQCSVPGCAHKTLLNEYTGSDLGYCTDSHLRHAASHPMVSDGPRIVLLLLLLSIFANVE